MVEEPQSSPIVARSASLPSAEQIAPAAISLETFVVCFMISYYCFVIFSFSLRGAASFSTHTHMRALQKRYLYDVPKLSIIIIISPANSENPCGQDSNMTPYITYILS